MKYKIILEPQEESGYTVYVPALPGCISQGETVEEAMDNIKEAITVYLESLKERGIDLPQVEELEAGGNPFPPVSPSPTQREGIFSFTPQKVSSPSTGEE